MTLEHMQEITLFYVGGDPRQSVQVHVTSVNMKKRACTYFYLEI